MSINLPMRTGVEKCMDMSVSVCMGAEKYTCMFVLVIIGTGKRMGVSAQMRTGVEKYIGMSVPRARE